MITKILVLAGIMFLPLIEIRLAIPTGLLTGALNLPFGITLNGFGFPPLFVFFLASIMGFCLAFILFNLLHLLDRPLKRSRFSRRYVQLLEKMQKRIRPYVEKYGLYGLAFYISLPIPGSGIYAGSMAGYVIGMKRREFYMAAFIGSSVAAFVVTSATMLGMSLF